MTKLKSVVKLPEKKEVLPYDTGDRNAWMYPVRNRLIEDIGNIDVDEAFKKWAEKNGWVKLCPHSTPANKYCRECAHEKLEEEYNECDRCYDKHAKSKGYIKREDMELCEEKIAEALFNQDHLDTGQKWSDYSFGKHSEVGQGYRYRAKAIAEAKPFKEKEG